MSQKGKNIVELTDEQFAAFKMLFPIIPAQRVEGSESKKKDRRKLKNDYRLEIQAEWNKKYPFS